MANSNSENPHVGLRFQESVKLILEKKFCTSFEQEAVVAISCQCIIQRDQRKVGENNSSVWYALCVQCS